CLPAPAPTALYTLSLHDALPICGRRGVALDDTHVFGPYAEAVRRQLRQRRLVTLSVRLQPCGERDRTVRLDGDADGVEVARARKDRKSTRLNSSHRTISYAVFCL